MGVQVARLDLVPVSPAEPLDKFSFSLFVRLPAELQLEILSHCPQNDLVCLSLASRFFRALALPMIPAKPKLQSFDQALPTSAIRCRCGNDKMDRVGQPPFGRASRRHVYEYDDERIRYDVEYSFRCHYGTPCRAYGPEHRCGQRGCKHCLCTTCPLYVQLRGWMGEERRYCNMCDRFTKRRRVKNYRCLHGRPLVRRKPKNHHWAAKKKYRARNAPQQ